MLRLKSQSFRSLLIAVACCVSSDSGVVETVFNGLHDDFTQDHLNWSTSVFCRD
jgi:hypothetical protein